MTVLKHVKMSNGMKVIKIRSADRCSKYECKGNLLTVKGIAERDEKYYKVLAYCDLCGEMYAFTRLNRRYVR